MRPLVDEGLRTVLVLGPACDGLWRRALRAAPAWLSTMADRGSETYVPDRLALTLLGSPWTPRFSSTRSLAPDKGLLGECLNLAMARALRAARSAQHDGRPWVRDLRPRSSRIDSARQSLDSEI